MAAAAAPEPRVLAIASHVTYGYVGNKMATFVMQALGCDVSAIHTVNFSNHTAYKQFRGRKTPADEITALYDGLVSATLADFDMLLSGYTGSPEAVEALGRIAKDLKSRAANQPGKFFWILDPVMGDNGALYVDAAIPPVYRALLPHADLILPNAFEAETLTSIAPLTSRAALRAALHALHARHSVPHVVITSVHLPVDPASSDNATSLAIVGSSATSAGAPRPFILRVPRLPLFFSGTGDMFAALVAVRLREASAAAGLLETAAWAPPDRIEAPSTPLALAVRRALLSMHAVLAATAAGVDAGASLGADAGVAHLERTKASEIRVPRFVEQLRSPEGVEGVEIVVEELGGLGDAEREVR